MEKKRSSVWNHFPDNENGKAKCGYCAISLSCKGGSTAKLIRYLKSKHHGMLSGEKSAISHMDEGVEKETEVPITVSEEWNRVMKI